MTAPKITTSQPPRIEAVTLGYASIDHFFRVASYPEMGQKRPYHSHSIMGGGQAATGAVALSRWGVTTRYVGRVGGDHTGDQAIEWLRREHVIADGAIKTRGVKSQSAYIIVPDDCGERTVIWHRHPRLNLTASDLKEEWFQGVQVLFIDGHELEAAVTAAQWVKDQGGIVVLDAEHIGQFRDTLLTRTDIAVGSEDFGHREFGTPDPEETIKCLRNYGVNIAGVTLGARGSMLDWGEGIRRFRAVRVSAVDTTGAGDVYHAALAYGALHRMEPRKMADFASAAASLSCRSLGGRSAIPSLDEIDAVLDREGSLEIVGG